MSELQSHHCIFEQINHMQTVVHGHPQLSLKRRLPNRISFEVFGRCFCKLTRGHVKRYAVALSVYGGSQSRLCPGPRVHLIRPCLTANVAFVQMDQASDIFHTQRAKGKVSFILSKVSHLPHHMSFPNTAEQQGASLNAFTLRSTTQQVFLH